MLGSNIAKKKVPKKVPRKIKLNKSKKEAWSVTICESGENHTGMEILGEKAKRGFSVEELKICEQKINEIGGITEYYDLKELGLSGDDERFGRATEAGLLVIKNGVELLKGKSYNFRHEMKNIVCDKTYFDVRRGKVLNKRARHNVCFAYFDQNADINNKKGTVININSLKQLKTVISNLHLYLGEKAENLIAELNHYYDIRKCGIGFHGDTERRIVICVRLGESFPLNFYWYENSKRVGNRVEIYLEEGDVYIMSDKAVGWDWKLKRNNRLTLRHASGCAKFLK